MIRRHYPSIASILSEHPSTSLLVNCTGLGSLKLSDVSDTNVYPTRGQTVLVAEPKEPIDRMYEADHMYQAPLPTLSPPGLVAEHLSLRASELIPRSLGT